MPQTLTIRESESGDSFDAEIPDDLWLDMQAYCAAANITLQELLDAALERFFATRHAD